eukprot:TRINITY_DN15825_c0_g1_i1.p1 TRINITY_DN15825_c0_g1~~TRINITY_DN15825_c0_g1_i1.p1  ORF type:complete len:848 (-),score=105.46 TRINITY_DN15825_c0_g1_i1:68-2560(-)
MEADQDAWKHTSCNLPVPQSRGETFELAPSLTHMPIERESYEQHDHSNGKPLANRTRTSVTSMDALELKEFFRELDSLSITVKFHIGALELISQSDLEELSSSFGCSDLPVLDLMVYFQELFHCGEEELEKVRLCVGWISDDHGYVGLSEFRENLAEGCRLSRAIKQCGAELRAHVADAGEECTLPKRDKLVSWVVGKTDRDDCLITLPMTLIYMIVFTVCIVLHLGIWKRQELETSLTKWMQRPPDILLGPFIDVHVNSPGSYRAWLGQTAIDAIYGQSETDASVYLANGSTTAGMMIRSASHSVLIADAWIEKTRLNGSVETAVFLDTETARSFLSLNPHALTDAARVSLLDMDKLGFFDDDTHKLNFILCFYNVPNEMWSLVEVTATFNDDGFVLPEVSVFAIMVDGFQDTFSYLFDVFFCCFILFVAFNEGREAAAALSLGCGELWDYLQFTNIVDWCSVIFGCCSCSVWVVIWTRLKDECLQKLLRPTSEGTYGRLDMSLDFLSIDAQQSQGIRDALRGLKWWINVLATVATLNSFFVVLRFFKGFRSNNRLKVVTHTLWASSTDIIHFFIVFCPVNLCFVVIAHVLFGIDLPEFQTFGFALIACFCALMGEFAWYTSLFGGYLRKLPSGLPLGVVQAWYLFYMFFVVLVMLNMLLSIILGEYSKTYRRLVTNAPTLIAQSQQYIQSKWQARSSMSLSRIRRLLENDSDPAHPDFAVSQDSLLTAFPGMKPPQADSIIKAVSEETGDPIETLEEIELTRESERLVVTNTLSALKIFDVVDRKKSSFECLIPMLERDRRITLGEETERAETCVAESSSNSSSSAGW